MAGAIGAGAAPGASAAPADLRARLEQVRARIAQAAEAAGRSPRSITLVAVSKSHPAAAIRAALEAGQRVFGENRIQEAKTKWPALKAAFPDIELHLIGPLQTNKVREAVALFDLIHTLDRPKLAIALAREMAAQGKRPSCLVEVNIGAEAQKSGLAPDDVAPFVAACREDYKLPLVGLMCIPPLGLPPEPFFLRLAGLARQLSLPFLSMGMSEDFPLAISRGATHVRVGTAIFGPREKP
jgi:PLP dependent protein